MVHFRRVVGTAARGPGGSAEESDRISDEAVVHLQDVYDHVLRVTDWIETQRDLLTGLLEADLAVVSNQPEPGHEAHDLVGRDPPQSPRSSPGSTA